MKAIDVVCGVIYNSNKEILITQIGDEKNYGKWEFPGGKVQHGEGLKNSIIREIQEELNINIIAGEIVFTNKITVDKIIYNLIFIEGQYDSGEIHLTEHLSHHWVSLEALKNFEFIRGDIPFVKTFF